MQQAIAMNRFGLGATANQVAPGDPRAWLLNQIDAYDSEPAVIRAAPTRSAVAEVQLGFIAGGRAKKMDDQRAQQRPPDPREDGPATQGQPAVLVEAKRAERQQYIDHVQARTTVALGSATPFMERLVYFWANHFAISIDKRLVRGMAGPMEFEAIRKNLTGKFYDMLVAVEQHPAMLFYLDQQVSVGPNSPANSSRGNRKAIGYNENLGREILELHTLGVRSGYSQDDVIQPAPAR